MALSSTAVFEVRATGDDTNGGFYNPARGGSTDYSQQNAAQLAVTDLVTNGTTTATSATGGFTSAMVGSGINIAGTIYEIMFRASSNSITLDRIATSGTGQRAKVGGALATINAATLIAVQGNLIWATGTFYISNPLTLTAFNNEGWQGNLNLFGYGSARGDNGYATVNCLSGCTAFINSGSGAWRIEGFDANCAGFATYGIRNTAGYPGSIQRCKVRGFTGIAIEQGSGSVINCEIYSNAVGATAAVGATTLLESCRIHDLTCKGTSSQIVTRCDFYNLVGSTIDAIDTSAGLSTSATYCRFYNIGRDAIASNGSYDIGNSRIAGNVVSGARYLLTAGAGAAAGSGTDITRTRIVSGNAYHNLSGTGAPYNKSTVAMPGDVSFSVSPFNNASTGDFRLTTSAQNAIIAAGGIVPSDWMQNPTGGGAVRVGMQGGFNG